MASIQVTGQPYSAMVNNGGPTNPYQSAGGPDFSTANGSLNNGIYTPGSQSGSFTQSAAPVTGGKYNPPTQGIQGVSNTTITGDQSARAAGYSDFAAYQQAQAKNGQNSAFTAPDGSGTFPSYNDYVNSVNSTYGDVFNSYEQNKGYVNNTLRPDTQNYISNTYDSTLPQLNTQYQQGQAGFQNQLSQNSNQLAQQQAITNDQTSQYQQGVKQRFGAEGSNSTSDALQAYYARTGQQGLNQEQATAGQNAGSIQNQQGQLQQWFAGQQQIIAAQKAQALSEAQMKFDQQISDINSSESQSQQAKAQAKLGLLNNLQQQAAQIQAQEKAFQNQLVTNAQQIAGNLQTSTAMGLAYKGQPVNTQALISPQFAAISGLGGQSGDSFQNAYGALSRNKSPYDLANNFAGIGK